jgi:tRNA nucleotidyltransferase (CCA-adding enzyme)
MNAPVRAFMTKKVITAPPSVTIRDIEDIFYRLDIGHLPIVAGTKLVGLVTRSDYLRSIDSRHSTQTESPPDREENGSGESSIRY